MGASKQKQGTYEITKVRVSKSLLVPPYGGEVMNSAIQVHFSDTWNAFEVHLCRYSSRGRYVPFEQILSMRGAENVGPEQTRLFQLAVKDKVRDLVLNWTVDAPAHLTYSRSALLTALTVLFCANVEVAAAHRI